MSTMPGLASKAEKGKSKFQSLDINNLYRHSLGENLERSAQKSAAPLKHGMQSLGKVPSARRPPANLPSVKAEQNNTSSTPTTVTSESQVATAGGQGSAVVPLLQQEHSQQPQSWVGKQGTGDKIGTVGGAGGLPMGTLATTGPQSQQQQQPLTLQLSAHQAAIALPITNTILPPQKQQQNSQQQNAQQLTAQQQIQQGTLSVYHHMTAVQQAQLQHLQMQTAAVAAAAAQVAQTQQTQGGTGLSQGANGTTGPADKSWSSVMSSVNVDGHGAMVAMGAALGLGGTVGGGAAGSHHHHSLHHHGMQGVGGMQQPPPYHSVQFQHEFPSLSASTGTADSGGGVTGIGGNVGNGRVGNQGGISVQQSHIIQQPPPLALGGPDVQYGPGPSLRPQTEGSWMQGGGAQARISGHQQPHQTTVPVAGQGNQSSQPNVVSVPGTQQMSAHFRGIMPSFMFRGSHFPPMNGHHGPLPPQHQQSMAAQQHHPQHSEGRQGHQGPARRGGAPADQPLEVITHRPIIREEELSRMDDMVRDMGWAAHEDIDYNQQLAFSDDDDSIIEDGGGKFQSGIGGAGSQRGKILGMQNANQNDHRSDRSDNHHRSGSHPNHQSQSQQLHKDSLHHHHHSMHQQHQDSTNSNYQSSYGSRQQQQPSQASSTSSGNNSASCVGGQNAPSATLCQQKSWSSSGSSSTGGSGGNRSSGATITRRSNECDDEIAERRRQQNQAMSTVIERARQRKEEEEKRYLDSKQAANKKLQELDERSKNKREQREFDESTGTITQASVPPQPIMHSTIPVPEWEREKDNRDNRERILRENSDEKSLKSSISDENTAVTPSPSASNFHQLTQIESGRGNTYRKDTTSGSLTSSLRVGCSNTVTETGTPPPFSRQFQTNLPPRFQKQKQQATVGAGISGGPLSLGALGGQYDPGRYAAGKGNSPPQQQQDRGDRQQPMQGPRGAKEDKDMHQRERDRDIREDRDRDDHSSRGYAASRGKQTSNSNTPSSSFNLPQGPDEGVTYRQTRYSSSSNRYSDDYSREYDYNSNNNTGSGINRTVVGKSNNMTTSSSVGKELDRRGYEKQDSIEMENTRGSRHSSSDEWVSGRDRYDRERPQRPDSRDSRASRDSRHSIESAPRHSEPRDFSSWSESPYEPPYEADQQHKQQQKHQQQLQSRHLTVPGPITKERLEQFSDELKSSDKHHDVGQAHHHSGGLQHQPQQRTSGLTQLKRGGGGVDKKIVDDDAWTIRRGGSSSTKEGSGSIDAGLGSGSGGTVSTAWADSMPDDKQLEKQISDNHDNKKDCDDSKGRRIDSRNIGSNKNSNNWSDSGRESAPYCRNNSWSSSKKSSSNTSSISGGGVGGNRSDRSDRLSQYSRNQRPPSVKSGESEGSADEVSVSVESSAKDEVTKHIKKIEKDEKNKELLRAILPELTKKPQQSITSDSKSKDTSGSGCNAAYIPRGEPSRHGRGGGSNSGNFRGGRSSVGGGVKRMDYYGLPAASKSPFGNNQDDKEKKIGDDSAVASHVTDEDKAKVQQKKEQLPNEQDKERYGKSKRSDSRRNKQRGPKDDGDLVSDNSEDGKGGKRLDNQHKLSNRSGGSGNVPFSGGVRKTATSNAAGGQMGNQQQPRQQNNSDKRYGNSYSNSGRQNSSSNLRNTSRKDNISTKEEVEDDLPNIEDSFQDGRIKKTATTGMKQEDIKSSSPVTATAVCNVKVPLLSGGGAIVVASTSSTAMAVVPAPGGKIDKDGSKSVGASSGIGKPGGKPGGPPGLSQQHIANIPSLMSVPINPPMMKGQYDRDRGLRQHKLPPRFAKQREHRLNNQHQQQHVGQANMDQQSSIHTSTSASDAIKPPTTSSVTFASDSGTQISGSGTVTSASSSTATPVGNAWDKPLAVTQLRSSAGGGLVVESEGMMVGGQVGDSVGKVKDGEVDKSGILSECAAPVNTIIFENSNYKSTSSPAGTAVRVPITNNRNTGPPLPPSNGGSASSSIIASNTQPRSMQQQMEDQAAAAAEAAVLGTLSSGKGDNGSKSDVNMMFSKEDDAGMKMDFFESEISHLTDDKSSGKNIGLARSIQQTMVGSAAGSISASTADALNIKIQSVKKVWENANDHPVVVQDDGNGFVSGFGSDHNSLDPSGAFGKSVDTPDDTHEGYIPSPNQNVSSANTNVCKVKPNQQATAAAAAAAAAQAAVHSANIVSAGSMVSVSQHQHQQQQVQVQQAQHQAHAQAAAVAAQAAAQAVAAQAAAAQAVQMGHHGSTMVGHQVLGHPLSPPPPLSNAAVLGAASCQPTGGGGAFGTGQHLGYQSLGGTTNYNLSAIPSPPTVLHQFSSSQSQLQAAVAAAVQQTSLYGNFSQMEAQSHQVATARAPQYATPQYANPYGIGATASSPYSTSVPPPQSLYLPPSGPPPPHGPPPGPPSSGTGAPGPVPPPPDHLYQNLNNYRLAAAAVAAAAGGSPFANQQSNPATVLISSSNSNSLMSASVVGKSGLGGGSGNGGGASGSGQISAIGTKAGGVGPAYTSHSHSQQAAQQLAYMTYDLSMGAYHLPPPPPQQRGQQGGGPPPGHPPPQGSSQVQQSNSSYYNQNTGGQTGYFQPQQSGGVNTSGQQPQLGNSGSGGGLATQHAAAAAYNLQAVATAAALFGNQSHQPISNATSLQNYGSHYLNNNLLAAINVQQQQQQQQQQYRSQQQYMKNSNQPLLMDQQPGSGGRQQLKSPGNQQDGLSSVFNSSPQIPSPKARQQNCKVQPPQQQQLAQMSQPSPPVSNIQHNKYNLYNVPPTMTIQPPPGQVRYPAPIQRPLNFQANLGSAQNTVSGNIPKHRPNNINNRPSTGSRQYYGQALNHTVNDVTKSDENTISKLSEQIVSTGGAANGTTVSTATHKAAAIATVGVNSNVTSNVAAVSSDSIASAKDTNNSNPQPQASNKDDTSAATGIKD